MECKNVLKEIVRLTKAQPLIHQEPDGTWGWAVENRGGIRKTRVEAELASARAILRLIRKVAEVWGGIDG